MEQKHTYKTQSVWITEGSIAAVDNSVIEVNQPNLFATDIPSYTILTISPSHLAWQQYSINKQRLLDEFFIYRKVLYKEKLHDYMSNILALVTMIIIVIGAFSPTVVRWWRSKRQLKENLNSTPVIELT